MSCSGAKAPGETCTQGWHFITLPEHACMNPAYRMGNCFRGDCRKTGERCAYQGTELAIARCPAYESAVLRNSNTNVPTPNW